MKIEHLIQAHRIFAEWQNVSPAADQSNPYSLLLLSIAPSVAKEELEERIKTMSEIRERQTQRLSAAASKFLEGDRDAEQLNQLLELVRTETSTIAFETVMRHLAR